MRWTVEMGLLYSVVRRHTNCTMSDPARDGDGQAARD